MSNIPPLPVTFFVPGLPKGQPRVRAVRRGKHVGVYDPGTADAWKGAVMAAALAKIRPDKPIAYPVMVNALFRFPRPQSHYRFGNVLPSAPEWHQGKPDRDNLDKAVLDALVDAGVLADDALVVCGTLAKTYANTMEPCGAYVTIDNP